MSVQFCRLWFSAVKVFAAGQRQVGVIRLVDAFVYAKSSFLGTGGFSPSFWLGKLVLENGFFRAFFP